MGKYKRYVVKFVGTEDDLKEFSEMVDEPDVQNYVLVLIALLKPHLFVIEEIKEDNHEMAYN